MNDQKKDQGASASPTPLSAISPAAREDAAAIGGANAQYAAAAKWWADRLRERPKQDNGVLMHGALAALAHRDSEPDKVDAFEGILFTRITSSRSRMLATDYGPESELYNAAVEAGIRTYCPPFPMKTVMWIDEHRVTVKYGYAAPFEIVWSRVSAAQGAEGGPKDGSEADPEA